MLKRSPAWRYWGIHRRCFFCRRAASALIHHTFGRHVSDILFTSPAIIVSALSGCFVCLSGRPPLYMHGILSCHLWSSAVSVRSIVKVMEILGIAHILKLLALCNVRTVVRLFQGLAQGCHHLTTVCHDDELHRVSNMSSLSCTCRDGWLVTNPIVVNARLLACLPSHGWNHHIDGST